MQIGIVGLGKMGGHMVERLLRDDHDVVAFDLNSEAVEQAKSKGASGAETLDELVNTLQPRRVVWIMVPAGDAVDKILEQIQPLLDPDDIIVDGGNSNYKDTLRRNETVSENGLSYVDVGMSGGVWGLEQGYSMMAGGSDEAIEYLTPVLKTLAPGPEKGWSHVGKTGAGHFVKMVHNGIEYGVMQAYAEGFAVLKNKKDFDVDLHQIAETWRFGSVIRSWLLDLTSKALEDNQAIDEIAPYVEDSGEGRWTVYDAIDMDIPTPVITLSLIERLRSRVSDSYTDKLLSAMRNQFGGHAMKKEEK